MFDLVFICLCQKLFNNMYFALFLNASGIFKCLKLKGLCGKTWGGFYCEAFTAEAVGFLLFVWGRLALKGI